MSGIPIENQEWQIVLSQDSIMAQLIHNGEPIVQETHEDIYLSLLSAIVSQQLSTKVAQVIKNRFLALFPDQYPQPELVLLQPDENLRGAGLSFQKIKYIKNVASFAQEGKLNYNIISTLDDEALISHLTQIKGVGRWTAEMILMFTLSRPDVFPVNDLGIQNAMKKLYGLNQSGKTLITKMDTIANSWIPYRTIACLYLWQSLDNS